MMKYGIVLAGIVLISGILHWANLSPYYIYPDSYQNILIAHHIQNFHSVVGTLGTHGQIWPDYFGWTRPGYSLLIFAVSLITHNYFSAAQAVTFTATILTPIIAYFFLKFLSGNRLTGVFAAVLVGVCANYSIWGGLIMTEGVGVLSLLIAIWSFFTIVIKDSRVAEVRDLLCGVAIAFAILVRYEYALLLIPVMSAIIVRSPTPGIKLLNLLSALVFVLSLVGTQLFPVRESLTRMNSQNYVLQIIGISSLIVFIVGSIAVRHWQRSLKIERWASAFCLAAVTIVAVLVLTQIIVPLFTFLTYQLSAPRNFFTLDFLLGISALVGFFHLHSEKKYMLGIWVAGNIGMFALFYYLVNPLMQRYWTHVIPFLLIPAAYGLRALFIRPRVVKLLTVALVIWQSTVSYHGIKSWSGGEYFTTSYSQEAAAIVKHYANNNQILLVSFPESYYSLTGVSTQSLTDKKPYIYIPDSLGTKEVLIIQDMGMYDHFPNFSRIVDAKLQPYLTTEKRVNRQYHYAQRSEKETTPLKIYKLSLHELTQILYAESI